MKTIQEIRNELASLADQVELVGLCMLDCQDFAEQQGSFSGLNVTMAGALAALANDLEETIRGE